MPHNDIGAAIKELRKALGDISQERFARRLGTTTRTVSRWEAAEALSPQILSRLRSIAISVGARDAVDFFESKLREDLDWEVDVVTEDATPGTPEEHALVSEFLKRYRANDQAIRPLIEELLIAIVADLRLQILQLERQKQSPKSSLADLMRGQPLQEPRLTLRDLMNTSPSASDADIVRAFLSGRSSGQDYLSVQAGLDPSGKPSAANLDKLSILAGLDPSGKKARPSAADVDNLSILAGLDPSGKKARPSAADVDKLSILAGLDPSGKKARPSAADVDKLSILAGLDPSRKKARPSAADVDKLSILAGLDPSGKKEKK